LVDVEEALRRNWTPAKRSLMSIGRIGARAAIVCVGILASSALAASPGWAAHGSRENVKLCRRYPGALFAQDGSAFQNTRACVRYVRRGGQLGGVDAVAEPPVEGSFKETCTGFGLEPSTPTLTLESRCGATYSNGDATGQYGPQEANGTWAVSTTIPCTLGGGQVVSLQVLASDLEGSTVEREFPPPSDC
jgi:hypothetical protein